MLAGPHDVGRLSLDHHISKGNALGIVHPEPVLRSLGIDECLDVIGMANAISGADVNPNSFHHDDLFSGYACSNRYSAAPVSCNLNAMVPGVPDAGCRQAWCG